MAKTPSKSATRGDLHDLAGSAPAMATLQDLKGANPFFGGRGHAVAQSKSNKKGSKLRMRINLVAVAEALSAEGLDPAIEMVRILQSQVPLMTRGGAPVIDEDGEPIMVDALDADTKLRTLNEMLQYTQPKLKAVELKISGALDLTTEQLDVRLAALLNKAAGGR